MHPNRPFDCSKRAHGGAVESQGSSGTGSLGMPPDAKLDRLYARIPCSNNGRYAPSLSRCVRQRPQAFPRPTKGRICQTVLHRSELEKGVSAG